MEEEYAEDPLNDEEEDVKKEQQESEGDLDLQAACWGTVQVKME
jgi:hypothetical protein